MTISDEEAREMLGTVIRRKIDINSDDLQTFFSFFERRTVNKREQLLRAGEHSKHIFFVLKGCLRSYTIDAKGVEHILLFGFEEYWINDLYSFLGNRASAYFIDALAETEVLMASKENYDLAFLAVPCLERYFRLAIELAYVTLQSRLMASHSETAEEKYIALQTRFPYIEQRVAQHQIASYLGITPESLSRIRKKITKKRELNTCCLCFTVLQKRGMFHRFPELWKG